ncbi:two-component system sensor histidine kinase DctS [Melghiribacillus thermohalophilus]|uniref:histidine kinase n=2 Tax=Melghiribacillus thermohalophilus TaxID=1324956 RepID=A0A4R3MQT4_9BACI|nr:two-component system sensor histidine kinase DctS [Melghiribacillus thermohalophilus]
MSLKRMPIKLKIMILSFGVVLFCLMIGGIILIGNIYQDRERELGERGLMIGRMVANLPEVKDYITETEGWRKLNPMIDQIRTINRADYIVVLNMNRIRYSHPIEEKLGTISSGKDEGAAFAEHSYVSKAKGELGVSVRSFVPIMNDQHEQIGVVVVGNVMPTLKEILSNIQTEILLTLLLTGLFGVIGSWLLARHLKDQTFQLEPHEIARILQERTAIFQAMNEGVIAVDRHGVIVVFNDKAKKIFGIHDDVIGKRPEDLAGYSSLRQFLLDQSDLENEIVFVGDKHILTNRVPVQVEGEKVGILTIFLDQTDVTKMAEELSGVKAFVDALRVQNHEHMNKLHTIAGLIQLDQKERALDYVFEVTEGQKKLSRFLTKNIQDYSVAGLLISKVQRGNELGIEVQIDENTSLKNYPAHMDGNDFVIILGNLIENSFDALRGDKKQEKLVYVSIVEKKDSIQISVEDNGRGMNSEIIEHIFEKGYTTKKNEGSGIGLYLVQKMAEKAKGKIEVISHPGEGTSFYLQFPLEMEENMNEQRQAN